MSFKDFRFKYILSFFLITLIFLGCSSEKGGKIGTKAPFITGKNLAGKIVKITDFKQLLVLVFIQEGCSFCLKNLPNLDALASKYQLRVVAVDTKSSQAAFEKMVKKLDLKHIEFLKDNLDLSWEKYSVFATPTIVFIKNDKVINRFIGDKKWPPIKAKLLALLS